MTIRLVTIASLFLWAAVTSLPTQAAPPPQGSAAATKPAAGVPRSNPPAKPAANGARRAKPPSGFTEVTGLDIQVEAVGRKPKQAPASYNPKEVGIDKVVPTADKPKTAAKDAATSGHPAQ
jgi:hypothetical protein